MAHHIRRGALVLGSLLVVFGAMPAQAAGCFSVYSLDNRLLYRSEVSPVDLSRPLSETLPRVFPAGSSMSFVTDEVPCPAVALSAPAPSGASALPPAKKSSSAAADADWAASPSGIPTAQERAAPTPEGPGVYRSLQADGDMSPQERARSAHERWLQTQAVRDARMKAAIAATSERRVAAPLVVGASEPSSVPEPASQAEQSNSQRSSYRYSRRGGRRR